MRIKLSKLKMLIKESLDNFLYMSKHDAENLIKSKPGNDLADNDIVDEETGEVYVEKGKQYSTSDLHSTHHSKKPKPIEKSTIDKYNDAIMDFAKNWSNFSSESPDITKEDYSSIAYDAALDFMIMQNQNDINDWIDELDMTYDEIMTNAADSIYSAMIGEL